MEGFKKIYKECDLSYGRFTGDASQLSSKNSLLKSRHLNNVVDVGGKLLYG